MAIILQGMCYSGKSTLGKMIADSLHIPFLDSRDLFIQTHGVSEIEYLNINGRNRFIDAEKKSLRRPFEHIVLSLGGSAVYYPKEMGVLKKNYTIIWLNVSFDVIQERKNAENKKRPVVYPDGISTFKELYDQRTLLYPKYADYTISVTKAEPPEITRDKVLLLLQ